MRSTHGAALVLVACAPVVLAMCRFDEDPLEAPPSASVVAVWNALAYEIVFAEDSFRTFKGHRTLTMMHLAMHDAINAVSPRYASYAFSGRDPLADPVVAAAQAAHDVLASQYPSARAAVEKELTRQLAAASEGTGASRGVVLGRGAAAAIARARDGDHWDSAGTYSYDSRPGAYRTTPPWNGFVAQPGFRYATPFGLTTPSELRPPPPPSLSSANYVAALDEVRRMGSLTSTERTADQTLYAVWWMEFAEGSVNRLARRLVVARQLQLAESARVFALLNASLYDVYVAVWDAKYEYNHWRPYTAVREATGDGNPATNADTSWQSLRPAQPFPEYVSAHAAGCAAAFAILESLLGDQAFTLSTITAPARMPERQFGHFADAANECADSRVRLGYHFRYSTDAGLALGREVAQALLTRRLLPR